MRRPLTGRTVAVTGVLEPEDVAVAIVGAITRPRAIVHVPRTIQWAPMLRPFLPMAARTFLSGAFKLDRVFLDHDRAARRDYHERISQ